MKEQLSYIAVLRSLSILVVVFFHSYGYMYAASHFPASVEQYNHAYYWLNQCVFINLAMPLFTVISGFLFNHLYHHGKYHNYWRLIRQKSLRLLLPFFVFGVLLMATTGTPFKPWWLLAEGISHLFYLQVLFWCFVVGGIFQRHIKENWGKFLCFAISASACILTSTYKIPLPHILGFYNLPHWYCWFLLGQLLADYRPYIEKLSIPRIFACILFFPYLVQIYFWPVPYADITWYMFLTIALFLIGLIYLTALNAKIFEHCHSLIWLSKYSFGIYIFHNWIGPYLISRTAKRIFPLEQLAANHLVLFPLCLTIVILFISFILSWGILKTRIGKFLIG